MIRRRSRTSRSAFARTCSTAGCIFNATVFDTAWVDLQAAGVVYDPITGAQIPTLVTTNVGEAEAKGAEFELTILPTENFLISLGLGILDTAYTEIKPGTMTGHLPLNSGTEFAQAPDEELHARPTAHRRRLDGGGTWVSRLDYNYQGQFWRSEPFLRVDGVPGSAGRLRGERRLGHLEHAVRLLAG